MILSIIIPIYNVEQYVEKCIRSCENQNLPKDQYEIICINDGSPDNSLNIVESLASQYSNIVVISQNNRGLSAARNTGIDCAKGEYVWFVDSDDWIEENCLFELSHYMTGVEVISINSLYYNYTDGNQKVHILHQNANNGRYLTTHRYVVMAQLYIYRRDIFKKYNYYFKVGILHEDTNLNPRLLYLVESIKCCEKPYYHYLQRCNSITSKFNPKKIDDLLDTFSVLWEFGQNNVLPCDRKLWYRQCLPSCVAEILYLSKQSADVIMRNRVKSYVNGHKECSYVLRLSDSLGLKFLGLLSLILGGNLYLAYSLLYRIRYRK